jgi:hypothetical protein
MSTSGTAGKIVRSNLVISLTGQRTAALVFFVPDHPKGPEKQQDQYRKGKICDKTPS